MNPQDLLGLPEEQAKAMADAAGYVTEVAIRDHQCLMMNDLWHVKPKLTLDVTAGLVTRVRLSRDEEDEDSRES